MKAVAVILAALIATALGVGYGSNRQSTYHFTQPIVYSAHLRPAHFNYGLSYGHGHGHGHGYGYGYGHGYGYGGYRIPIYYPPAYVHHSYQPHSYRTSSYH